jgi:hypothetical protein
MVRIQVSAEVAAQMMKPGEAIEIVDTRGMRVGFVSRPITDEEIREARRLADSQPAGSTLDQVWTRIRSGDTGQ